MVANEEVFKGVTIGKYTDDSIQLSKDLNKHIKGNVIFFCVGTDRSTGDSFAPLIGTMLKEKGYKNVIGTIDEPVHAMNISERIKEIPEGKTVLAIDAALGKIKNVGSLSLNSGSLHPGAGIGKELPLVGDFHIHGTVNVSGFQEFFVLQNTRLSLVIKLAKQCVNAIESAFPLVNYDAEHDGLLKLIK